LRFTFFSRFLKDFESQFIWSLVFSGLTIRCWQLDSQLTGGAGGIWFWVSLVPLAGYFHILNLWEPRENGPGLWKMIRDDSRNEMFPRLAKLIGYQKK
jgi:hypothetical protein